MTAILKVDEIQDTAGNNIINESSDTITIGASGDTVNVIGTLQSNGSAVPTVAGGITEADQWRLTANFTGDANPLSSNLERVDTSGWGKLGTGMSVSSGIFTFPSTGVWLVQFRLNTYKNAQNLYAAAGIQVTTNNSSYANIAYGEQGITNAGLNVYANTLVETLIDCTDTSNVKVKFVIDNENDSTNVVGHSSVTYTSMMFIRLGDT